MSVISYIFIVFLLCTVLVYYIVPKKMQWGVLLIASLIFYGYAGVEYLMLVSVTAIVVYLFSLRLQKSLDEQEKLAEGADRRTARKISSREDEEEEISCDGAGCCHRYTGGVQGHGLYHNQYQKVYSV